MASDFLKGFLTLVKRPPPAWGFEERRRLVRVRCSYRCVFDANGTRYPATVKDLGEGGLRLQSDEPLTRGQSITIFCPFVDVEGACGPVKGEVCWSRSLGSDACLAGVRYTSAASDLSDSWISWVLHLLGFPGQVPPSKRNWARLECRLPGLLNAQPVELLNLGLGGARLQGAAPASTSLVTLQVGPLGKLPVLTVEGRVLRDETGTSRCEFAEMNPQQIRLLSAYLKELLSRK